MLNKMKLKINSLNDLNNIERRNKFPKLKMNHTKNNSNSIEKYQNIMTESSEKYIKKLSSDSLISIEDYIKENNELKKRIETLENENIIIKKENIKLKKENLILIKKNEDHIIKIDSNYLIKKQKILNNNKNNNYYNNNNKITFKPFTSENINIDNINKNNFILKKHNFLLNNNYNDLTESKLNFINNNSSQKINNIKIFKLSNNNFSINKSLSINNGYNNNYYSEKDIKNKMDYLFKRTKNLLNRFNEILSN